MKRVRLSGRCVKKSKLQKIAKTRETLLNFHENKEKSSDSEKCRVKGSRIINIAYLLQQLNDVHKFEILSGTDVKCIWKQLKTSSTEQFKASPIDTFYCVEKVEPFNANNSLL
ncbi:hypothetical protein PV328_012235, partial [Microctonus aethiopoides]